MKLTTSVRETIYPATPTPPQVLVLSNNDQVMPRLYTRMLYYYLAKQEGSSLKLASSAILRSSLSQALALFYPLAGRLKEREDRGLNLDCNDAGAEFVEAEADGTLERFADFQPAAALEDLVPPVDAALPLEKLPLLLVQVTRFQCGGVTLGVSSHHSVGDGFALSSFTVAWNEIALGKEVSTLPHHDRSLLAARHPPNPRFPHPEYTLTLPSFPSSFPAMSAKRFHFGASQIEALKHKASSTSDGVSSCFTGFESLAGHLWRCVTRARGLDPAQEIKLGMAVDGRNRLNPPLPAGYSGNVNFYGLAETTASELVEQPLHHAAACVHRAVARITDEYIRSALDFVAQQESPVSVFPSFSTFGTDFAITSWTRFPLYEVGFGLGRPDFVGIAASGWDGLIVLLPGHGDEKGGVNALVGLRSDHLAKLESDPELVG